ncbi:MAG: hypothetical protein GF383_02995 [Candidatus Lokiarchaeota archaeon]|nr:hypothetical protein [Candidatus Lokiarchaeota archaeon]
MQKKYPEDDRYKSISSFCHHSLEKVLEIFEKGKTLDDFDKVVDAETEELYGSNSFRAFIPLHEPALAMNRYEEINFDFVSRLVFALMRTYLKNHEDDPIESAQRWFERIRSYYMTTNLRKIFNIEISRLKGDNFLVRFEFSADIANAHFENCKFIAAVFGCLGVVIEDLVYSKKQIYVRFDLVPTDLFYDKEIRKKERIKLMKNNVAKLIDYNRILEDKDFYLWTKLAQYDDISLQFKNQYSLEKRIKPILDNIRESADRRIYPQKILKFFEKLHWIRLDEMLTSFQIIGPDQLDSEIKDTVIEFISDYYNITKKKEMYYLEQK